jgi:hypothetical protein|tara:strand:+ start:166 stop:435 length:270 start_codon:yes stop_codon:yes gene_type:complete
MSSLHPGVTFYEEDRDSGPFMIRIGGTSEFVSFIDADDPSSWPPGCVDTVDGWENSKVLTYNTMDEALAAADVVWDIEGFHTNIEIAPS